MITEDYVSFEVAKLLKEKRFDEYTAMVYNQNRSFMPNGAIEDTYQTFYSAPTLQMAMKWLETKYRFLFVIYHSIETGNLSFSWRIYQLQSDKCHYVEELKGIGEYYIDGNDYNSREECCDSAIKYCLENLI